MLLQINNLGKKFKRGQSEFWAIKNVNLSAEQDSFICVTGRSGSGKSTMLNCIAGLIKPTEGEIILEGDNIENKSDNEMASLRNNIIGIIPQGNSLMSNFNVADNIKIPFYFSKRDGNPEKYAEELIKMMKLESVAQSYPKQLSGGEMRRTAIARALINHPKLLLADEPTSNLDKENAENVMNILRDIAHQGTAVIMVTHETEFIKKIDKIYHMNYKSNRNYT